MAAPSAVAADTADVDGTVYAMAQVGDRTIIGGDFTEVGGEPRRNAAAILADGRVDPTFAPEPDGIVFAVAAAEDGSRVFLGGEFTSAGGAARQGLAAVDPSTGAAVESWTADTNDLVYALAVKGHRLYVGGKYTFIGGHHRRRLAWVDVSTAAVDLKFSPGATWTVRAITVSPDGSKVYAVGGFKEIGRAPRDGAAEVNATDGRATAFDPTNGGFAIAVALTPDGSRMFFSTASNYLYAYEPSSSNEPVWTVKSGGDTQGIAATDAEVYFGGHFGQLNTYKLKRSRIASVHVADGTPTDWDPNITQSHMGVWAVNLTSDSVLIGGDFKRIGNEWHRGFARFPGSP